MTLGKKERMIAVIVLIAALAAAIHFLVFQKKAQTYDQTQKEFADAKQKLDTAEFITDQAAFDAYKARTTEYSSLVTSVVSELNLQKMDMATSPPVGALDQWASTTIALLNQLNAARSGRVRLTFLEQAGWNLTPELPSAGAVGALADRVSHLNEVYPQLQFASEPAQQAQARQGYNTQLQAVGVPPQETSNFYFPQANLFFNDIKFLENMMRSTPGGMSSAQNLLPYYNPYSLQRFGTAIPAIKKIWVYNLVAQQLQRESGATPVNPNMLLKFGEALEVGIPLDSSEPLNSINKQLRALLDFISIAERSGVQEITSVRLLRPINVAKATLFVPGATPAPTATPAATPAMNPMMDPMMMDPMMMDMGMTGLPGGPTATVTPVPDTDRVGTGAGIELELRGENAALTRFYYDLSHLTRTYGIDDLYYFVNPQDRTLRSSSTIEVITDVKLDGATAGATVQ